MHVDVLILFYFISFYCIVYSCTLVNSIVKSVAWKPNENMRYIWKEKCISLSNFNSASFPVAMCMSVWQMVENSGGTSNKTKYKMNITTTIQEATILVHVFSKSENIVNYIISHRFRCIWIFRHKIPELYKNLAVYTIAPTSI